MLWSILHVISGKAKPHSRNSRAKWQQAWTFIVAGGTTKGGNTTYLEGAQEEELADWRAWNVLATWCSKRGLAVYGAMEWTLAL